MLGMEQGSFEESVKWLNQGGPMDLEWLGDGKTAERIVKIIEEDA